MTNFLSSISNLKNAKNLKTKISEELMPIAWNPNRWWKFCVPADEIKDIETIFTQYWF